MSAQRPYLLSHLVADAADRSPRSLAVTCGDERIDHEQLAQRVATLGTAMRERGIAPGDRVAIFAPKSIDTLVSLYAAMHAGAIAAPIDPLAPASVVEDIYHELRPTAAVLSDETADRWPAHAREALTIGRRAPAGVSHLGWDEVSTIEPKGPVSRLGVDPAYLITTSGSTGRPKGIVHTHTSGLRYAELAAGCYGLGPDDHMANVAPFHFDQSTFELYAAPLAGASVVLVGDAMLRFPASVSQLIEKSE